MRRVIKELPRDRGEGRTTTAQSKAKATALLTSDVETAMPKSADISDEDRVKQVLAERLCR